MEPGLARSAHALSGWWIPQCASPAPLVEMAFAAQRRRWPEGQRAGVGRRRLEARQQGRAPALIE